MNIFLIYLIFLLNIISVYKCDDDLGQVVFVNILYRHGDRTPVKPYPNDPYRDESFWPVPFGQLTNVGKHQHLLLGKWFRKRYSKLLPQYYSVYDIYVRSTDVDRTLMSAESNLAGLYTPIGNQTWDIKNWMPIPVHTVPETDDNILAGKKFCDKYMQELERVLDSPELQNINKENAELFKYLSEKSGTKIFNLETLEYLYNTLFIENLNNMTLPEWTKPVFPEKMKGLAAKSFTTQAYNKILQRLRIGPLLKEMIHHMSQKSKNILSPNRKIWMYSAHDDTVANFLMTLNLFEPHSPPFASAIMVELRTDNRGEHFVTIFYKNSSEPILMTLPGCLPKCPLSQFIRLTKDVIPVNWDKECLTTLQTNELNMNTSGIIACLSMSIVMLIILITLLIIFVYGHFKQYSNFYYLRLTDGK